MSDSCGCPLDAAVLKAFLRLNGNGVLGGGTDESAARHGCAGGGGVADEAGGGVVGVCTVPMETERSGWMASASTR